MSTRRTILTGAAIAGVIALSATTGAIAAGQIGTAGIKDGGVRGVDVADGEFGIKSVDVTDGKLRELDLRPGVQAKLNASPYDGMVRRVANYTNGGGGYATVACADDEATSQTYTAISGGVYQARFSPDGSFDDTQVYPAIVQSFAGRMDWDGPDNAPGTDDNTVKPNRLDGWVIKFQGGNASTLQVYALCVPTTSIPTQITNY